MAAPAARRRRGGRPAHRRSRASASRARSARGVGSPTRFDRDLIDASLDTRTGEAWAIRAALWLGALVVVALMRRPTLRPRGGLMVLTAALVVSLPLAGHADTQDPQALLVPADVVHVVAAGAWLGGLAILLVAFWRRPDTPRRRASTREVLRGSPCPP